MKRLERLLGIALLLSARRRLRAQSLAEHFDISVRTVYRDVAALLEAGFPIVGTPGDGYLLPSTSQLRPLAMEPSEAEALVMGARMLEVHADDALRARLQSAVCKLEAVLEPAAVRRLREHRDTVIVSAHNLRQKGPLGLFLEAVGNHEVVDLSYAGGSGELTRREIEPLGLVQIGEDWVVPAYCRLRRDLRVFRVDRVHDARLTGIKFPPREAVTLADFVDVRERGTKVH